MEIDFSPITGKGIRSLKNFNDVAEAIISEWQRRSKLTESVAPYEGANGFLRRELYRLILHYLAHDEARFFERVIRDEGRALTSRVKLDENPFHFGLLAVFTDDSYVTRQDRSVIATQMLYAYHHGVPPTFLIGFIHQAGSKHEIKRKLIEGFIEPGFEATHRRYLKDVKIGRFR
jgi:hypothetical protein